MLLSLVNYRLQPRRSAHPQPPCLLPPYILTSLLPYLVFDRHVTKIPSPQPLCFPHLQDRDARNSFRFCSYANCRVSMRSRHLSTFNCAVCIPDASSGPLNLATRFDLSPFFSNSCALFCTYQELNSFVFMPFRTLCKKPPGVGVPPSFTEAQIEVHLHRAEHVLRPAWPLSSTVHGSRDTGHPSSGCRPSRRMLRFGVP